MLRMGEIFQRNPISGDFPWVHFFLVSTQSDKKCDFWSSEAHLRVQTANC